MCFYVYADHAQYTIKTYSKMTLFPLILTGPLSVFAAESDVQYGTLEEKSELQQFSAENQPCIEKL